MSTFFTNKAKAVYCCILLFCLNLLTLQAAGWQRHAAPSPVWQITPIVVDGIQTGLLLGCQDNHVYSLSSNGDIEWSFDTKGLPSQLISHDLDGEGTAEVIVATHDAAGTLYVLSNTGEVLNSFTHGKPFSSIGISTSNGIRIFGATYDNQLFLFDHNLNLVNMNTWAKPNPSSWYQALKVGDITGDGNEEIVVLNMQGTISIFNTDGILLKREKIGGSSKRGDLFLVDINGDSRKELIIISAGVVHENFAVEYKDGALNTLFTFDKLGTSSSMTIIDDFLPKAGLDVLCYDPYVFNNLVYVQGLNASGLSQRNKKEITKEHMNLPLCVTLSADKATIIAGSVGTRDNSYYTISSSAFESENYPLLPEVNLSAPALQSLATAVQSVPAKEMEGDKPYVIFLRGYVNQYNWDSMDGWAKAMESFEELAPHVKVVIEFPVDTKTKMTHQELMDFTDKLEREEVPFTYEMSSGSSPSDISIAEMEEVLQRAPNMCYGFATTENARYARKATDPWKNTFFPMVLEVAELCKTYGKTINVQENSSGWAMYAGDPDVITQWFAPELKGTIIPIVRNNSNGVYQAINATLGLEAAGFSDGWGVSIQDWMWINQGKHLIAGMVPRELMTRSNMMAAAMGARYFQFEAGNFAMEDMMKITANPDAPTDLHEDAVFFQYVRKGMFPGYHSSQIKNFSKHAIGLEYNDDLWLQIQNQWFLGMWNPSVKSELNSGVLGMHTDLQPLPEKCVYKHLYNVEYNRADNFKTPYGLVPTVPSPYPLQPGGIDFQLIKTDRHVYLGDDVKYEDTNLLLSTFEGAASKQPFRTMDAFLSVYTHLDGYLLYVVGTEYFEMDDGFVSIHIADNIEAETAIDYISGEEFEVVDDKIVTSIPGGVIRILYVPAVTGRTLHETNNRIKIYPNPADDELYIELADETLPATDITIFDSMGRVMTNLVTEARQHRVNTSTWSPGFYVLSILGSDEKKKIIVK
jgi:hypothetical protein